MIRFHNPRLNRPKSEWTDQDFIDQALALQRGEYDKSGSNVASDILRDDPSENDALTPFDS